MESTLYALGALIAIAGLAGLVLPGLPGLPLVFLGIVLVAWADAFLRISPASLLLIGVLALMGSIFDVLGTLMGARRFGASRWGLLGAGIGLLVGLPFGVPGLVLGPALGAVGLEYARDSDVRRAGRAGFGVLVGLVLGTALKYAVAMTMIGLALAAFAW